ncbi:MAG: type II toxin-antitoxin system MqsA family antitoxin, partial [SAR324 cluster bacterium]|nr:type II toxin-antitoxin system MqsA family antitoxin [SAR324 cluster bacterium]
MKLKGFCPNCDNESDLEKEEKVESFSVKGINIPVPVIVFTCQQCGEDFYDPDTDPHDIAFREYRKSKGWTQPEDIVSFRKRYGFTQNELADLLGWGVATLSRYENGALQSESHEKVLKLLEDPVNMLRILKQGASSLSDERRDELTQSVEDRKSEWISEFFRDIFPKDKEDEFSGNRKFDMVKFKNAILFFCKGGCFKTCLNKLLFYADFKAFKDFNQSMTGARYLRFQFGPVVSKSNFYFAAMVEDGSL